MQQSKNRSSTTKASAEQHEQRMDSDDMDKIISKLKAMWKKMAESTEWYEYQVENSGNK